MTPAGWFIAGWISASVFIALGIWWQYHRAKRRMAAESGDTSVWLEDQAWYGHGDQP